MRSLNKIIGKNVVIMLSDINKTELDAKITDIDDECNTRWFEFEDTDGNIIWLSEGLLGICSIKIIKEK